MSLKRERSPSFPSAESHASPNKRSRSASFTRETKAAPPQPVIDASSATQFTVVYPAVSAAAKKKLKKDALAENEELLKLSSYMESPFKLEGSNLDIQYTVLPNAQWAGLKKYNNFIIQQEVYKTGDCVFVKPESLDVPSRNNTIADPKQFWIGRILQVRANNPQNVFALVAWVYWPQELPGVKGKREPGAQKWHGEWEVIPSNYMDVLDVLSFAGHANVEFYDEERDKPVNMLYWRQILNHDTLELSPLKPHCSCKGHYNLDPDKTMIICDNAKCQTWLHPECIIDSVLLKTYEELSSSSGQAEKVKTSKQKKKPYAGKLIGKLKDDNQILKVEITDLRPGKNRAILERPALCMECGVELLR